MMFDPPSPMWYAAPDSEAVARLSSRLLGKTNPREWAGFAPGTALVVRIDSSPRLFGTWLVKVFLTSTPRHSLGGAFPMEDLYPRCQHGWLGDDSLWATDPKPSWWRRLWRRIRKTV